MSDTNVSSVVARSTGLSRSHQYMNDEALITFAIPYYDNLEFLRLAVDSVHRQTISNWRLIVCDDSTQGEPVNELIRSYDDHRSVYYKNNRNLGIAGNWNRCLELASTEYVTLLHADDELKPHYGEVMTTVAKEEPGHAAYYCNASIIDKEGKGIFSFADFYKRFLNPSEKHRSSLTGESGVALILKGDFIFCPSVCYRKSLLGTMKFSSKWKMVLDLAFLTDILLEGKSILGVPDDAYCYRRHNNNQTSLLTESLLRFREEAAIYSDLERRLAEKNWHRAAKVARRRRIIKLNLLYCAVLDAIHLRFASSRRKLALLLQLLYGVDLLQGK